MSPTLPARWQSLRAGLLTAHLSHAGGGVFTSVRQFSKMLEAEPGLEVDVFGPSGAGRDFSDWSPLTPRISSILGPSSFSYAPGLARRLVHSDLDLVHLHGLWMHTSVACHGFTRKTGKPHIISPHGMLDAWALKNSGWKKRLAARLFEDANIRTSACLHALNAAEERSIRSYGYAGPVCVVPNGVDLPAANEPPPPLPWWRKGEPETKVILYLGRLHPKKGLVNLVAAWSCLDPKLREHWRLIVGGWEEHGHQVLLQRLALSLGVQSTITFPGPLFGQDKKAAFHHCDGFILPSVSEGLPVAVLEAWAYGKPVIMTPQCNLPEGFEATAALCVEPEKESLIGGLTSFMLMDEAKRRSIGVNGRALAEQRFAWPIVAAKMAAVYRWVAGRAPQPETIDTTARP